MCHQAKIFVGLFGDFFFSVDIVIKLRAAFLQGKHLAKLVTPKPVAMEFLE